MVDLTASYSVVGWYLMTEFSMVQPQMSSGTWGMEMRDKVESKEQMRIERDMRL